MKYVKPEVVVQGSALTTVHGQKQSSVQSDATPFELTINAYEVDE